ncbi:MAG TPA: two-component sensor histidine kinase, partial [Candidatus Copromonas avistercoris]|nr:two-component sensor histidine kinase [Candidatus Copromonas avistercoris]
MKSIQARLTITFIGLMVALLVIVWGVNRWYLEDFYVNQKVESLMRAYDTIDRQIERNEKAGISIEKAMERKLDSSGNIVEGNLQKLIRDYSDSANVSVLMVDNSSADATVYSTSRDTQFLKDRIDRYIFGWSQSQNELVEEKENYKIQKTYDPRRGSMYLESWGFFSDNSTAFIMSTPLSSLGESADVSNQFLANAGVLVTIIGGVFVYLLAKQITKP